MERECKRKMGLLQLAPIDIDKVAIGKDVLRVKFGLERDSNWGKSTDLDGTEKGDTDSADC